MTTTLILNATNAELVAHFLESAPSCITEHILEFNTNHRETMQHVFSDLFRFVFCPFYFRAPFHFRTEEEDISTQQRNRALLCDKIDIVFKCHRCDGKKKSKTVLKHLNYGFNRPNARMCDVRRVSFCDVCHYYIDKHHDEYFDSDSDSDLDVSDDE
jgi:hypothetical protein